MQTLPPFEQLCFGGVILPETLEHPRPCQLEMEQVRMMTTGCKSTLSRKAKGRAKANTQSRKELAQVSQATRAIQTSPRARTVAELNSERKTAGDQVEELATIPPVTTATHRKTRTTRKAKAKANKWTSWKRISPVKQPQPCRILHRHRARLELSRAIQTWNRKVGSWV